ncbi:ribosome small subunit-dependent GTPase A [Spiroplasma endosymbiont of Labia minor]|uniref:ribosome small subunit-dependent GTPase A n=1 Tax=Spiroplasma endosymbiont of Labia minor TaxID=3066305 RepID=UPI0030CDE8BF
MILNGLVTRVISEFCSVRVNKNKIYECKAKGIFRYNNYKITVGDYVEFEITDDNFKMGSITKIFDRKNELYRPRIVNIDRVVIVTAVANPTFASYLLNKYIAFVKILGTEPILAFTKVDLLPTNSPIRKQLEWYKDLNYEIYYINNKLKRANLEWMKFKSMLEENKITVFTGQTGAGKSTTLNHLMPKLQLQTQEISKALNRGKHTTTKNELYEYKNGFIADTPGFSSFELNDVTSFQLSRAYNFFNERYIYCKFKNCLHINVNIDDCAIINAVKKGEFPEFIYNDYVKIQEEIKKNEREKY